MFRIMLAYLSILYEKFWLRKGIERKVLYMFKNVNIIVLILMKIILLNAFSSI